MEAEGIEAFAAAAREFCSVIPRLASLSLPERLTTARLRVLAVYTAALSLPSRPDAGDEEPGEDPEALGGWLGFEERDLYWEVFDPYEQSEPVCGSLSDDLLDIYRDVQEGLTLWDASHKMDAVWHWRFAFDTHWGDHAVDALRALHRACREAV